MFALIIAALMMLAPPTALAQQEQSFTPVAGATLQAKQDAAIAQGTGARASRFWTAYAFDVRPGHVVDIDYVSDDGRFIIQGNWESSDTGFIVRDPGVETRNLGVFTLRDATGQIVRVEIYNLGRRREYGGYPVYWLGRASNEESLNFLRAIIEQSKSDDMASDAVRAVAMHDDRRVPEFLERIARSTAFDSVRAQAVRSLGEPPVSDATREYLAQLARDERESTDVRRAAISAYGRSRDAQALTFLQGVYNSFTSRDLKRTALANISRNQNNDAAAGFLIRVATQESDQELRKQAVSRLGEIAGDRALGTLKEMVGKSDADTELQKQAVVAIARRPVAESVPLLINIARTHTKPEIRKQAFVLLGRTGDPTAVEFLKSVLTK